MDNISLISIGKVINTFNDISASMHEVRSQPSILHIYPPYAEALLHIESCEYLEVIYYFHQLIDHPTPLTRTNRQGIPYGLFATRLPERPNLIGVSIVRLISVKANELFVAHLDALNNSPLLDIKPHPAP